MNFFNTDLLGVIICKPKIYSDNRGHFMESFRKDMLEEFLGYKIDFCQENQSQSNKGVIRGLHYQIQPYAQSKLVSVISGKALDIIVDIRRNSPTFGQYIKEEISSVNKKQIFIPKGFAHGFLSLEDETVFSYKVDNYYSKNHERGILYNDSEISIDWELENFGEIFISKKDLELPNLLNVNDFEYEDKLYE